MSKTITITSAVVAPVIALGLMAAPASAQSWRDRDHDRGERTTRNTVVGAVVGTYRSMSPEQRLGWLVAHLGDLPGSPASASAAATSSAADTVSV